MCLFYLFVGFSKSLSKELGSRNITVNVIAPGYIDTDMTSSKSALNCSHSPIKQEVMDQTLFVLFYCICVWCYRSSLPFLDLKQPTPFSRSLSFSYYPRTIFQRIFHIFISLMQPSRHTRGPQEGHCCKDIPWSSRSSRRCR